MIKKLRLKNFGPHKDSTFVFSKGMNVIIGETAAGKSAVIRSLRLLRYSKPAGKSFISWWADQSEVELTTSDNKLISRLDGKERAYYHSDYDHPFTAFGSDVPKEILDTLSLDDVNLQLQHESLFLLSGTAGNAAQHFSKIAKLDKINISQSNIKKWLNGLRNDVEYIKTTIEAKEKQLDAFADLNSIEVQVEVLEQLESQTMQLKKSYNMIGDILDAIEEVETEISSNDLSYLEEPINACLKLIEETDVLESKQKKLAQILYDIEQVDFAIDALEAKTDVSALMEELEDRINDDREMISDSNDLMTLLTRIKTVETELVMLENAYDKDHTQFEKEFDNGCPLCGNKFVNIA